jgi:hypothetical protein
MKVCVGFILILIISASAQDLGTFGETFSIEEEDMLAVIRERLSHITPQDMKNHQESIRRQFEYQLLSLIHI